MRKPSTLLREAAEDLAALKLPPSAKFDMRHFGICPGPRPSPCKTTACVAGWLSLMPKWQKRGFKSRWGNSVRLTLGEWQLFPAGYGRFENMGADVFQVDREDLRAIFHSVYASRCEVIEMFEDLAEKYEAMDL